MQCNCDERVTSCGARPSRCCRDDYNLVQLKSTNNELKHLINRLEDLSESVNIDIHRRSRSRSRSRVMFQDPGIFEHVIDCNVKQVRSCTPVASPCRCDAPQVSHRCPPCVPQTYHCESDYFKELNAVRRDANLFPVKVDSYHKHAGLHDTSCVTCERQSRSRARTRSCSRASSRCSRSPSAYRYSMNMIKPKWNGGPFINNYLWRDEKLAENK